MQPPPIKPATPTSQSSKFELLLEEEFPKIFFDDLEEIERAVRKDIAVEDALMRLLEEDEDGRVPSTKRVTAEDLRPALARLAELRRMSQSDLNTLYEEASDRKLRAQKAEAVAKNEQQFFHKPFATADFERWCQHEYWTVDEAAALMLSKEPAVVSRAPMLRLPDSPFVSQYQRLQRLIHRALETGKIGEDPRVVPKLLLAWARKKHINIPLELEAQVRAHNDEPDWRTHCERLTLENERLRQELDAQKQELQTLRPFDNTETALARKSVLKLILGMAILRFEYRTDQRSSTAKIIAGGLADLSLYHQLDLKLSDDTVREWLGKAAQELEIEWASPIEQRGICGVLKPKSD